MPPKSMTEWKHLRERGCLVGLGGFIYVPGMTIKGFILMQKNYNLSGGERTGTGGIFYENEFTLF